MRSEFDKHGNLITIDPESGTRIRPREVYEDTLWVGMGDAGKKKQRLAKLKSKQKRRQEIYKAKKLKQRKAIAIDRRAREERVRKKHVMLSKNALRQRRAKSKLVEQAIHQPTLGYSHTALVGDGLAGFEIDAISVGAEAKFKPGELAQIREVEDFGLISVSEKNYNEVESVIDPTLGWPSVKKAWKSAKGAVSSATKKLNSAVSTATGPIKTAHAKTVGKIQKAAVDKTKDIGEAAGKKSFNIVNAARKKAGEVGVVYAKYTTGGGFLKMAPGGKWLYNTTDSYSGGALTDTANISSMTARITRGDKISKEELIRNAIFAAKVAVVVGTAGAAGPITTGGYATLTAIGAGQLKQGKLGESKYGRAAIDVSAAVATGDGSTLSEKATSAGQKEFEKQADKKLAQIDEKAKEEINKRLSYKGFSPLLLQTQLSKNAHLLDIKIDDVSNLKLTPEQIKSNVAKVTNAESAKVKKAMDKATNSGIKLNVMTDTIGSLEKKQEALLQYAKTASPEDAKKMLAEAQAVGADLQKYYGMYQMMQQETMELAYQAELAKSEAALKVAAAQEGRFPPSSGKGLLIAGGVIAAIAAVAVGS